MYYRPQGLEERLAEQKLMQEQRMAEQRMLEQKILQDQKLAEQRLAEQKLMQERRLNEQLLREAQLRARELEVSTQARPLASGPHSGYPIGGPVGASATPFVPHADSHSSANSGPHSGPHSVPYGQSVNFQGIPAGSKMQQEKQDVIQKSFRTLETPKPPEVMGPIVQEIRQVSTANQELLAELQQAASLQFGLSKYAPVYETAPAELHSIAPDSIQPPSLSEEDKERLKRIELPHFETKQEPKSPIPTKSNAIFLPEE